MFKRLVARGSRARRFAASAILSAFALAAGIASAQSADYFDNGRYIDRSYESAPSYEYAVPVEPQYLRERPREYRVIVVPEKRVRRYEYGYDYDRAQPPDRHGGYFEPAPYASGYRDPAYEQGYRDGVADADRRYDVYGRARMEGEVLLPPAPVGRPYRPIGY